VVANIAEVYRKRQYPNMLASKSADSDAEATETQVWLGFARDCGYMTKERHDQLLEGYEQIGKMLGSMITHPEKLIPQNRIEG
jgi:four helix bundle protein